MAGAMIIYDSKYGNTRLVAEKIAEGMRPSSGVEVEVRELKEINPGGLSEFDAIVIGSPNHMGNATRSIRKFIDAGMKVVAYDPQALPGELTGKMETVGNGYDALDGADGLVIFTDWQEFRTPDFEVITEKLNKPVIFDGRNLYDPAYIKKQGIEYHCIGRP